LSPSNIERLKCPWAQSWSALPQSGDIRGGSGLTYHEGPPGPTELLRQVLARWPMRNGSVASRRLTLRLIFVGPRVALCSRKSGGGGRPLASIFEAEGAERGSQGPGCPYGTQNYCGRSARYSNVNTAMVPKVVPIVITWVLLRQGLASVANGLVIQRQRVEHFPERPVVGLRPLAADGAVVGHGRALPVRVW
jgi:hypothetical protein